MLKFYRLLVVCEKANAKDGKQQAEYSEANHKNK